MKVYFLLATLMLSGLAVTAQNLERDTLTLEDGLTYWKGMEIQVGVGADSSTKNFKELYIGSKWAAKKTLTSDWAGRKLKVVGFQKVTMDLGYGPIDQFILVLSADNKVKLLCNIEEAQGNGEIVENREASIGPPPAQN